MTEQLLQLLNCTEEGSFRVLAFEVFTVLTVSTFLFTVGYSINSDFNTLGYSIDAVSNTVVSREVDGFEYIFSVVVLCENFQLARRTDGSLLLYLSACHESGLSRGRWIDGNGSGYLLSDFFFFI